MKIFTHTCAICGDEFQTSCNTAKYCKYCRDKAQVNRNKAYAEKKKNGETKPVGSTQKCPICGKDFVKKSGIQKCCTDCAKIQVTQRKIATNSVYTKKTYEQVRFVLPMGQRSILKEYAASLGMSVNRLLVKSLIEYQKNHPTGTPLLPDPETGDGEDEEI